MAEREKGVATAPCPNCGAEQPVVEQADGSVAGGTCEKCFPAPTPEKASTPTPSREQGTTTEEK